MKIAITSIAYKTGDGKLSNAELSERFGESVMRKIADMSGILERRIAVRGECASDLAVEAARLLEKRGLSALSDVDLLIFGTQTPDYIMPTTACILQDRLGIGKSCAAFDINLGCSQFPYALATAAAWLNSSLAKKALIITADTPSRLINPLDKSTVSLFGDAAAATVVEKSSDDSIVDFEFGTNGKGFDHLICPSSGMRNPPAPADYLETADENGNLRSNVNMKIDGFKIFAFAYKTVPVTVENILRRNRLGVADVDLFVFHQAGEMMVSSVAKRLKIPPSKVYYKMHDIGNCGGASIPIALADAALHGRIKAGMKVVVCAFGVGLSWGASLIEWSENFRGAATLDDYSASPPKPKSQSYADK